MCNFYKMTQHSLIASAMMNTSFFFPHAGTLCEDKSSRSRGERCDKRDSH